MGQAIVGAARMFVLAAALATAGCNPYQETLREAPVQAPTGTQSQIDTFRAAFILAYQTEPTLVAVRDPVSGSLSYTAVAPPAPGSAATVVTDTNYLNAGFALVKSNCEDFFSKEGRLQQTVNVFKDLNNAFLPIASGAVALSGNGGNAAGIIALVGAANNGVLTTVQTDFLFSSDNIDAVRTLVMKALSAHETAVRANMAAPGTTISFDWVTEQIRDHQDTCSPAGILSITKQAIQNATPVPAASTQGSVPAAPPAPGGTLARGALLPLTGAPGLQPPAPTAEIVIPSNFRMPSGGAAVETQVDVTQSPTPPPAKRPSQRFNIVAFNPGSVASRDTFMKCLYPGMVKIDNSGAPVDATGKPVPEDMRVHGQITHWMAMEGIGGETIAGLAMTPSQSVQRGTAVKLFCPP